MTQVLAIDDFIKEAKRQELQLFSQDLLVTNNKLKEENDFLKEKLKSLEQMLMNQVSYNPITDEELICMEQIKSLKSKSSSRELSLDETKRLDIFIKNLRLIREQSTEVINTADYRDLGEEALVRIASSTTEDK